MKFHKICKKCKGVSRGSCLYFSLPAEDFVIYSRRGGNIVDTDPSMIMERRVAALSSYGEHGRRVSPARFTVSSRKLQLRSIKRPLSHGFHR